MEYRRPDDDAGQDVADDERLVDKLHQQRHSRADDDYQAKSGKNRIHLK
jgi:hypothetical protein